MCDLLGMSFNLPINARISLDVFQRQGKENPDGWGVAYYQNDHLRLVKEPSPATNSTLFDFIESSTISKTYLSHVRRTTVGIRSYMNTHPFYRKLHIGSQRQEWAFAHNGTLETIEKVDPIRYKPLGETDSERAFCYILEWIEENDTLTWNNNSFSSLNTLLRDINDKTNTFNCLFTEGNYLFCYSDENRYNDGLRFIKQVSPFEKTDLVREDERLGSVEVREPFENEASKTSGYLIVTEKLTNVNWIEFKTGELVVFKNGHIVFPSSRLD